MAKAEATRRLMKKHNEVSGLHATEIIARHHDGAKNRSFHEIVLNGPMMSDLETLESKEVLPLLARNIAQLPAADHHFLYPRNFPFIVILTLSPFGSATRSISIVKSMALMIPGPNFSSINSLIVVP
jgi:hypothetical protein